MSAHLELDAEIIRLRADLAARTEERDALRRVIARVEAEEGADQCVREALFATDLMTGFGELTPLGRRALGVE